MSFNLETQKFQLESKLAIKTGLFREKSPRVYTGHAFPSKMEDLGAKAIVDLSV